MFIIPIPIVTAIPIKIQRPEEGLESTVGYTNPRQKEHHQSGIVACGTEST